MISTRLVGGGLVTELGKPTWCRAAISGETRLLVGEETLGVRRQSGLGTREAIVIGLPPTPHGAITAMLVADRIGGGTFDADDVQMIELLAGHASTRIQADGLIEAVRAEGAEKEYQSLHDYLTGLPNRRHFMERTVDPPTEPETLAVMIIDPARFTQSTDTLGHPPCAPPLTPP